MKDAIVTAVLALVLALGFVGQEFIPPLSFAEGARVVLAPVFFASARVLLPFPSMIVLAFLAGFFTDFAALQVVQLAADPDNLDTLQTVVGAVELSPGWSILVYVAFGLICQGLRPLVLRGHWWLPPLAAAVLTITHLAMQFGFITMRRFDTGGLFWSELVTWRILAPGAIAMVLALLLVVALEIVGHFTNQPRRVRDY